MPPSPASKPATLLALVLALAASMASPAPARALGDAALIYVAASSLTVAYDGLAFRLREAGASTVDMTASWPGGSDLGASYRLVVITPYGGPLDPAVGDDLAEFVAVGGGVVIMAEHFFGEEAGNELAARLGISARFIPMDTGGGCGSTDTTLATHPVTTSAPTIEFAWARFVEGGTVLYGTAAPIVTVEGTVVLAGDSDIFSDPVAFGGCPVGPSTERFHANLFTLLPDEGGGPSADGGPSGSDAGPSASDAGASSGGGLGSTCVTGADCSTGLCASDGARFYCTQVCTDTCPGVYVCQSAGTVSVCAPPASGGGCRATPGAPSSWAGALATALAAGLALRRHRSRRTRAARLASNTRRIALVSK